MAFRPEVGPTHAKTQWTIQDPLPREPDEPIVRVRSPLSSIVIIEHDAERGVTVRRTCGECKTLITSNRTIKRGRPFFDRGVGDPIYFIGAGATYRSLIVPHYGRIAFSDMERGKAFLQRFSYQQKKDWREITGVPFPYKYFK